MLFISITVNVQFKAKYSKKSVLSRCYGSYLRKMVNSSALFFFPSKMKYFPNTDKHSREHLSRVDGADDEISEEGKGTKLFALSARLSERIETCWSLFWQLKEN